MGKRTGILKSGCRGLALLLALGCVACATDPLATIKDKSGLRIVLHRESYVINVEGNGAVTFKDGIVPGYHSDQMSPEAVDELIEKFRAADFFALRDKYALEATDGEPVSITIFVGDKRKGVVDYFGTQAGMPRAVTDLESAIEQAAGRDKWVLGGNGLVESLKRENFDFKSWPAIYALYVATRTGAPETVRGFIAAGTPIDDPRIPQLLAVAITRKNAEIIDIISSAERR